MDRLCEMARIGTTKDDYEIVIFTNDGGKIPHFHYRDANTRGRKFHTCIRLDSAQYFHHGGKRDILNVKQRKELVDFLLSNAEEEDEGYTNWMLLLREWNRNNSDVKIDRNSKMPNYKALK